MSGLQIVVDGHWLSLETYPGDYTMDTCWPGGSDQLQWTDAAAIASRRFTGSEPVVAVQGGVPVWAGSLVEPDASQDQLTAQGAWREGDGFYALDGTGAATSKPDTAIDTAIGNGLRWTRPTSLQSSNAAVDVTTPVLLGTGLLDVWATNNNKRWGVNPQNRAVYAKPDDTIPTYQTCHLEGGIGYALDNYASTLKGRYLNTSSVLTTLTVTDSLAERLHGHVEAIVDLTNRGPISTTTATNALNGMLALGRATPQYTASIELAYGQIFNMGWVPVDLETVAAGVMLRINGGYDLAQRRNSAMYLDVIIGRTSLSGGLLTITPLNTAYRSLIDGLQLAIEGK